jgi:hypothetical protein
MKIKTLLKILLPFTAIFIVVNGVRYAWNCSLLQYWEEIGTNQLFASSIEDAKKKKIFIFEYTPSEKEISIDNGILKFKSIWLEKNAKRAYNYLWFDAIEPSPGVALIIADNGENLSPNDYFYRIVSTGAYSSGRIWNVGWVRMGERPTEAINIEIREKNGNGRKYVKLTPKND